MRKIKNVNELTEWFKLDKYLNIDGMGELATYENLALRRNLIDSVGFCRSGSGEVRDFIEGELIKEWDKIKSSPLSSSPAYLARQSNLSELNYSVDSWAVRSVTHGDCGFYSVPINRHDLAHDHNGRAKSVNSTNWLDNLNSIYIGTLEDDLLLKTGRSVVCLDLDNYSDKDILKDLKNKLPLLREQMTPLKNSKGIRGGDLEKIFEYKIIQLIDLHIWATLEDASIPLRVFASVLWPFGDKGELDLLRTVIPHAKKVINHTYLNAWEVELSNKI